MNHTVEHTAISLAIGGIKGQEGDPARSPHWYIHTYIPIYFPCTAGPSLYGAHHRGVGPASGSAHDGEAWEVWIQHCRAHASFLRSLSHHLTSAVQTSRCSCWTTAFASPRAQSRYGGCRATPPCLMWGRSGIKDLRAPWFGWGQSQLPLAGTTCDQAAAWRKLNYGISPHLPYPAVQCSHSVHLRRRSARRSLRL